MRKYLILSLAVSTDITYGVRAIFYFVYRRQMKRIYLLNIIYYIYNYTTLCILLTFKEPPLFEKKF